MRLIDVDALNFDGKDICQITDAIDDAPTIEMPVKRGKWVEYETSSYSGTDEYDEPIWIPKKYYRCSECRKGTAIQSAFCPHCGVDMRTEGA